jgi:NAD(P)-dependent dehydrogenase (short-subunit alcohol dehydrogenase family)
MAGTAEPSTEVVQAVSALIGTKRVVVITGASSGLGLSATKALCAKGYFVIAAVRDPSKMDAVAKESGLEKESYFAMELELACLQSVKDFVGNLRLLLADHPISDLICNGAVYLPNDPEPAWTEDGYEMPPGVNHLGHLLLTQLLVDDLKREGDARSSIVSFVAGNSNTIADSFMKPDAENQPVTWLSARGIRAAVRAAAATLLVVCRSSACYALAAEPSVAIVPSSLQCVRWRAAKAVVAAISLWIARSLKLAGLAGNPERNRAGQPIRCPWPFVLVALPWTAMGRRSLRAGFHDWQTWIMIALMALCI